MATDESRILVNDDEDDANNQQQFLELSQLLSSYYISCIIPAALILRGQDIAQRKEQHLPTRRSPSLFDQRLAWDSFCSRHGLRSDFVRHIRMPHDSFTRLLSVVRKDLEVDTEMAELRGGAILPEICLYVCLRYLAGGSYSDIKFFTGISVASFYRVLWKTIGASTRARVTSCRSSFQQLMMMLAMLPWGFNR
jgi:hypothetical protein